MLTHQEGKLTRAIEKQTSRVPSGIFLGAAGLSIVGSLVFYISGRKQFANLMGEWVPTLLLLGMYNKFVKEAT